VTIVSSAEPGAMGLSVLRGLERRGLAVSYVPYVDWLPRWSGPSFRGVGLVETTLGDLARPALEARLLAALARARPDVVLFLKCDDLHAGLYALARRVTGATLVAFHPDDPWSRRGLGRRGAAHARAVAQLRRVDHAFLWSRPLVERARAEGVRCDYLTFACDPELHARVDDVSDDERRAFGSDVCFIGNWDEEREAWLGPLADAGLDLAIWGTDYWVRRCRHPGIQRAWRGRPLYGREQAVAARASAVMVNVLRRQNKGACNMRTFEIPCVGGFMLHERSAEAAAYFPPGVACGDFTSPDDLVVQARRWLADPEGRARVMAEGHRRALAWTYAEWAGAMLDALGLT